MLRVVRAEDRYRGGDQGAGIDTRHAFSFGRFYDPDNVRFGPLTACNEERLAPGAGFPAHRHRDLEIVSWVVEGELTHEDASGAATVLGPGDVQRLSAGAGTVHAERNAGAAPLCFVQMWLVPATPGGAPEYEVVRGIADGTPYALPRADAVLHVRRLAEGGRTAVPAAPLAYVHVVRGTVSLGGGHAALRPGDSARLTDAGELAVTAGGGPAELLVWELAAV
ncbi:pirin family protein [Streptomyces radicis]|uniref:Pirin family protein n=1 Tax=Streptomyces radicis TaxID=1750517 RepID=A0A3A9WRA5_9ACTN|nr:pirin family protein [Streptomyces radicis]RKN12064.1 pirin family protein [Streptomyces radicis]RKN25885.1 pirin family protein [Streptomyces radicis]